MTGWPFRGVAAYPITPLDADGAIDAPALATLVDRACEAGVDAVATLGSTGGFAYLDRAQRRRAVAVAAEATGGRVPLVVGVGALATAAVCDLARDAAAAGADALLLPPMAYTPLTPDELRAHYAACAAATDRPLCVYDNPVTTHTTLDDALLARLAALPGVAAVKRPGPPAAEAAATHAALRGALPAGFSIGYSGDWRAAGALLAGGDAWHSVIAGVLPAPAVALTRAAMAGDAATAGRLDARLAPLWALFQAHGGLRVVHALAALMGLARDAPPAPVAPLAPAIRAEVEAALDALTAAP